jgi:CRP/FNR family cyclic AMP-dependent transcriptional regulator
MPVAAAAQGGAESLGLGRTYHDGEVIIRQGDAGECMYVLQSGRVEVVLTNEDGREVLLAKLSDPDIFGEMALCDREVRSATVRAVGEVRALTVDREMFLRRIHQDPSLALRVIQRLATRVRRADEALGKENPGRAQLHNVPP